MRFALCLFFFFVLGKSFSQEEADSLLHSIDSTTLPDTTSDYKHESLNSSLDINQRMQYLLNKKDSLSKLKTINKDSALAIEQPKELPIKKDVSSAKTNLFNKKDSSLSKGSDKIKSIKPNSISFFKTQLKAIKPHGSISGGYEYGILPFVAGDNYPAQGYKTEGRVSFLLLNVPLELTYYYTNIKNTIGLNNYFRLSYDANRYKDQLTDKLNVKNKLNVEKLDSLQFKQQGIIQKMEYLNFLKQYPGYKTPINDSLKNKYIWNSNPIVNMDSLPHLPDSAASPTIDTTGLTNIISDSLKSNSDYLHKKDSLSNEYSSYKAKYDSINKEINLIKKEIDQYKKLQDKPTTYTNPYFSKVQNILSGVQKFEIGLCHPTYSTLLVNNIPLKGINFEYFKNNKFFALTYGTTINNLLYNPNTIQGTMQGARNLYNYFDFGNLSAGRKIFSIKAGVGEKENSHIYVGILLGKGRSDYLMLSSVDVSSSSYSKESNVVVELDAKYKFSDQLNTEVIFGKSSVKEEDLTMELIKKSVNELFSNYRSNAFLVRINSSFKKTKTKLTFSARWIDPYFKSFGIGFMRSDNLRYEIKAEQPITNKIKYSIAYRREEDNLLKLYDYKNTLQSINNSLNLKLNRQINVRLIYTPLFRELTTPSSIIKDRNTISTVVISYTPRPKRVSSQFNALYSKYIISSDSNNINFENLTYTHQFLFKSGFKTDLNVSWFKNNLKDTLGNNTYLSVIGIGYTSKNTSTFTLGGKIAYKNNILPQYGFIAKVNVKIHKGLYWEAQFEKIIIGDYYNSFIIEKIKSFPYYSNTRLILNF